MIVRKKIRVTSPCVADRYTGWNERVIEFSGSKLGGLISFRETDDGSIIVEVYRADPGVVVRTGGKDHPAHDQADASDALLAQPPDGPQPEVVVYGSDGTPWTAEDILRREG